MSELKKLTFPNNNISGTVPSEIGLLNILEVMNLGECDLHDKINKIFSFVIIYFVNPFTIYHTLLYDNEIGNNVITGNIPSEIGNMKLLVNCDICE